MILPDSGHFLWFEPFMHPVKWNGKETTTFLKDIKKGTHFLIDIDLKHLVSLIEWCQNHDKECKTIVKNMVHFHKTFLDRKSSFMYQYMEGIIRCISNNCVSQPFQLPKAIQPTKEQLALMPEKGESLHRDTTDPQNQRAYKTFRASLPEGDVWNP